MSKTIKFVCGMDSDSFEKFVEEMGGSYDENCLYDDINGMLDDLPVCCWCLGYNIEDDEEEIEDDD